MHNHASPHKKASRADRFEIGRGKLCMRDEKDRSLFFQHFSSAQQDQTAESYRGTDKKNSQTLIKKSKGVVKSSDPDDAEKPGYGTMKQISERKGTGFLQPCYQTIQ